MHLLVVVVVGSEKDKYSKKFIILVRPFHSIISRSILKIGVNGISTFSTCHHNVQLKQSVLSVIVH